MGYVIDSNVVINYLSGQLTNNGMSLMNDIVNDGVHNFNNHQN